MRNKNKRLASILLAAMICVSALFIPCYAADFDTPIEEEEVEEFIDLSNLYGSISISSSGCATCAGYAISAVRSDTVYLYLTIQRSSDGSRWSNYANLGSTSGSPSAGLTKYYYVAPGYYYRTLVTVYVYNSNGTYIEGTDAASGSQYY